jgi:hypothetical protein
MKALIILNARFIQKMRLVEPVYIFSQARRTLCGVLLYNNDAPITSMNTKTKTTMAILATSAISLTVMANIDTIAFVNTAVAQNMTANATDTQ